MRVIVLPATPDAAPALDLLAATPRRMAQPSRASRRMASTLRATFEEGDVDAVVGLAVQGLAVEDRKRAVEAADAWRARTMPTCPCCASRAATEKTPSSSQLTA